MIFVVCIFYYRVVKFLLNGHTFLYLLRIAGAHKSCAQEVWLNSKDFHRQICKPSWEQG